MKKILILDGNNLGWRACGMAPLSYEGQRTEVISIGLSMVRNYISQFDPDRCMVAWDGGRDAERLKLYPDYKRHHKKEWTEVEKKERDLFFIQMNKLIEVLSKLGIEQYQLVKPKREADDVIYNLIVWSAEELNSKNLYTVVSSDQDFFQLFSGDWAEVTVYSPIKKKLINKEIAEEMLTIKMSDFLNYRALVGDPSDNLPGVKDIGPRWARWLVENVLTEEAPPIVVAPSQRRVIDLLSAGYEQFDLMKKLITFRLIGRDELNRGRLVNEVGSIPQMQEAMLGVCEEYGLARIEENFISFMNPFEMLWRKQEDNNYDDRRKE